MYPLDFLAAVLPSAGDYYCVTELSTRKKEHFYTKDINALPAKIHAWHQQELNVYFALASFATEGSREAANAVNVKSFFLDIDCAEDGPKTYGSKKEGYAAFVNFLQKTELDQLGNPFIVDSGGGLHVYWPLTQDMPIAAWKPVAENLKRLCKQEGLKIDFTVPADAARVLRVPGTQNFKRGGLQVKIRMAADPAEFDFTQFAQAVRSKLAAPVETTNVFELPGQRPSKPSANIDPNAFKNSVTLFKNILVKTQQGSGCGQLAHYIEHATEDGMEPLWRGLLSLTAKCDDGEKSAKRLTKLHPYTEERMLQKMREIKGPYPCTKFDSENPDVCPKCPHWGKITNPLALGRETAVSYDEAEIEVPQVAEDGSEPDELTPTVSYIRPVPPRGFSYGQHGGIYRDVETENEQGGKSTQHVQVLAFDLFVVDVMNLNNEHSVHMVALRPEGAVDVIIPQKAVVSKDETAKHLAMQNIIASYGSGNDKHLFEYVRAAVHDFSVTKKASKVPAQYGWQADGSFVVGNTIFYPNGTERTMPMPGLENLANATKTSGTLDAWRDMWLMLARKGHYDLLAMGMVGFGSPLMRFTGMNGMVYHLGSTESGTGKTLALQLAASVWGHPDRFRVGKATSDVAMIQRAGMLNSLPLLSDEITAKNRKDMEWFPAFVFDYSEGQGKERMESGANRERLNTTNWAGQCLLSSNTHMVDYMTGARRHSSEGELRRMLELTPTRQLHWTPEEEAIIMAFQQSFGIAGRIFAKWLAENQDVAREMTLKVRLRLKALFHIRGDERFWLAGVSSDVAAAILCGKKYANIIDLPVQPLIDVYKGMIEKARATMKATQREAEDVLNSYIREHYGNFVVLSAVNEIGAAFGNGTLIDKTVMKSDVAGRVEHGVAAGFTDFFIEEQLLKAYCSSMSFGYADFKRQLEAKFRVDYLKKDMMAKTKGPQMRVNVMKISRPESEDDLPAPEQQAA